jgi:hypothetical protein
MPVTGRFWLGRSLALPVCGVSLEAIDLAGQVVYAGVPQGRGKEGDPLWEPVMGRFLARTEPRAPGVRLVA